MTLHRRRFLASQAPPRHARSFARCAGATYPARPVKLVIGYPPGGSADITARLIAQFLGEKLGQSVIIESRPGGGTNIATETVINAPPDGYTLLLVAPANAISPLYERLNTTTCATSRRSPGLIRFPNVMVVNPSRSGHERPELIALPQSQSRQAQHGLIRQRLDATCRASCSR